MLVVEDESLIAMLVEDALIDAGAEVLGPAATVEEALALFESGNPNAAVLDINLAGQVSTPVADLLADREQIFKGLEMLRHRKHDVMVFHILDDDELTFPFGGMTRFEGLEEMPQLFCDPKALRDSYLEVLEEYLVEVRRGCTRMGVEYSLVRTSDYLDAVLSRFLFGRMSNKATPVRR